MEHIDVKAVKLTDDIKTNNTLTFHFPFLQFYFHLYQFCSVPQKTLQLSFPKWLIWSAGMPLACLEQMVREKLTKGTLAMYI